MKITDNEIKRIRPRQYKEYARIHFNGTENIHRCHDLAVFQIGYPETITAKRSVRKNGTPLGPWTFLWGIPPYAYQVDPNTSK